MMLVAEASYASQAIDSIGYCNIWYSSIVPVLPRGSTGGCIRGPRTKTSYASWFLGKPAVQSS